MPEAAASSTSRPWPRIAVAAMTWALLVALIIVAAGALTDDPAPAEVASTPSPELPPLTLTLDRELPEEIRRVRDVPRALQLLERRAARANTAEAWVDLGATRHAVGDPQGAVLSYQRALAIDPDRLDAQVGLLMVDSATESGRNRAATAFEDLAVANPDNAMLRFNQGMVAVYRRDTDTARRAFGVVQRVSPSSPLGKVAARLANAASGNDP